MTDITAQTSDDGPSFDKSYGTSGPANYQPTEQEAEAMRLANRLYHKAKRARERYDYKWMGYYKMFRGRQWRELRPSYRHSEVVNLVFQAIQSMVPVLTDSRPKPEFLPQEPGDLELSQILNHIAENDWERNNWFMMLTETIYDAHFYGTGFGSVMYDPKGEDGLGCIEYKSCDPFYSFPDPSATDLNSSCEYFVYAEPIDVTKLKEEYPDKADFIKPDLIEPSIGDRTELGDIRYQTTFDQRSTLEGRGNYDLTNKNQVLKITAYVKSNEFIEEEELSKDENGNETKSYVQKLKYPNGRKICVANGVLLDDGPIPYDDGRIPYARLVNYILPREFWGISEVEQLESPQKIFNKLVSFTLDVLTLMGNPVWIVDSTANIDPDTITNRPGLILEPEPNTRVQRVEGTQLQPYILQLIDRMKSWFDDVSGSSDVSRGQRPEGITAGIAITSLQEAAQTRLRLKSRNIDAFLQDIGQLYLSRVFQFYTVPRVVRLTGSDGATQFFKMSVENVDEYGKKRVIVRPMDGEERVYETQGKFDVRVVTGSSLPFSKQEKVTKALNLYDRQIIDAEEVLKALDYPNYEAVLQRLQEKQAQAAQMAQQAPLKTP